MTPTEVKAMVAQRVHATADSVDWTHLTITQKQSYYEAWTADPEIGGALASIIDPGRVRVYLKDTVMKSYRRAQRKTIQQLLASMSIDCDSVIREFIQPEGVLCEGTHLYTVAVAREWKGALMSVYERQYEIGRVQTNIVFFTEHTAGRFIDRSYRDLIQSAAQRLGVTIHWVT